MANKAKKLTLKISAGFPPSELKNIFKASFVRALERARRKPLVRSRRKPVVREGGAHCPWCPDQLGGRILKECTLRAESDGGYTVICRY
jgi:hypothetical protein